MDGHNNYQTTQALKNLLNQYSMQSTSRYMLPESIYGKVRLEPFVQMPLTEDVMFYACSRQRKCMTKYP